MIYLTGVSNPIICAEAVKHPWLGLMAQPASGVLPHWPHYLPGYAADNGAFGAWIKQQPFRPAPWRRMLDRLPVEEPPLFVVVPDVVADHEGTLDAWQEYAPEVLHRGLRAAFVLQNGCTDLEQVPTMADAVFIGGDDDYKTGPDATRVAWQARAEGMWVHMGRVNSGDRLCTAVGMGCDSADGTFLKYGPLFDRIHPRTGKPQVGQLNRLAEFVRLGRERGGQLGLTAIA